MPRLKCLIDYDGRHNTPWKRTMDSLRIEWKGHHMFAKFHKRAQNIDYDNKEEGKDILYYIVKAVKEALK